MDPTLTRRALLYAPGMLIIAIILFGMIVGAAAQVILGRSAAGINWPMAFATGIAGSFVGGLLSSLLAGDGLELRASGLVGSIVGAVIVTAGWLWWKGRSGSPAS
jgi:uncharacterized membrane protein YeaQ/YmgE (transglycosylase-associated protein family)